MRDLSSFAQGEVEQPVEIRVSREELKGLREALDRYDKQGSLGANLIGASEGTGDCALVLTFFFPRYPQLTKTVFVKLQPEEWGV